MATNPIQEAWKIFPEDGTYSVSTLGNIKNNITGKITKGHLIQCKSHSYYYHKLGKTGRTIAVHYMVLRTFIGERPEGYVCDHINRDPLDNRLSNLRYVSQSSNNANKDAAEIYKFNSRGEYITSYLTWSSAGLSIGVSGEYLRKRMHKNWGENGRYKEPYVKDSFFITKRDFHKTYKYLW